MSVDRQAAFWLAVLGGVALGLWLLRGILLPFVLGMAAGFLLDPLVSRLERHGLRRSLAASLIVVGSYGAGVLGLLLVAPAAAVQARRLWESLPTWLGRGVAALEPLAARLAGLAAPHGALDPSAAIEGVLHRAGDAAADLGTRVLSQGWAVANLAGLLAVTPFVAYYLLRDWPRLVAALDDLLPRAHAETIRFLARDVERLLVRFVRGQAIVCLALAVFYALALSAIGLEAGLLIGLVAGLVSFVPYVGTAIGLVAAVGQALAQAWPSMVLPALAFTIFVLGQLVTDYILSPWLVGERVGLHPLWVIFAVFAGGALFGPVGMLLAVPAGVVLAVVVRHAIGRYKDSTLYGAPPPPGGRPDAPGE